MKKQIIDLWVIYQSYQHPLEIVCVINVIITLKNSQNINADFEIRLAHRTAY